LARRPKPLLRIIADGVDTYSGVARILGISKEAVRKRCSYLIRQGLVRKPKGQWHGLKLTGLGLMRAGSPGTIGRVDLGYRCPRCGVLAFRADGQCPFNCRESDR